MLPFFSQNASTGVFPVLLIRQQGVLRFFVYNLANESWPLVLNDLDWFIEHGNGKKMYFDEVWKVYSNSPVQMLMILPFQNGWPSVTSPSVQPNSPLAVSDVENEQVRHKSFSPDRLP